MRPFNLLKEVEEEGLLGLLFDVRVLSRGMPKVDDPDKSLSDDITDKYNRLGIIHG